jgi:hypothetical protein
MPFAIAAMPFRNDILKLVYRTSARRTIVPLAPGFPGRRLPPGPAGKRAHPQAAGIR